MYMYDVPRYQSEGVHPPVHTPPMSPPPHDVTSQSSPHAVSYLDTIVVCSRTLHAVQNLWPRTTCTCKVKESISHVVSIHHAYMYMYIQPRETHALQYWHEAMEDRKHQQDYLASQ